MVTVPLSSKQLPSWTWEEGGRSPGSLPLFDGIMAFPGGSSPPPFFDGIKKVWKRFISPKESVPASPQQTFLLL